METRYYDTMTSPIGELTLTSDGEFLTAMSMETRHALDARYAWRADPAPLAHARREMEAYFAGELTVFTTPLRADGTDFQRRVWAALARIPYGVTTYYRAIAEQVESPRAVRAVGAANGRNPIAIIIPCHRVIGADGRLVGYGGGMDRKKWLLAHETSRLSLI